MPTLAYLQHTVAMPTAIQRGQGVGITDPRLVFYHCPAGTMVDPYSLEYQIFDVSTEAKQRSPVQVWPTTPGDRVTVDVGPNSADRLRPKPSKSDDLLPSMAGAFCAAWTPSATEPLGLHEVRWFWKRTSSSYEQTSTTAFDVSSVPIPVGSTLYALPSEAHAEGLRSAGCEGVSDARLMLALIKASKFIELVTRRFFEPRFLDLAVDGKNSGAIQLSAGTPIIGVDTIRYATTHLLLSSLAADASSYRVYSRHLSEGLLQPDDRNNPKIELYGLQDYMTIYSLADLRFPRGQQNIQVSGVFGYTDPDGSPSGCTPVLLKEAAIRLALRYVSKLTDSNAQQDQRFGWRVTMEKTREQSIQYSPGAMGGLSAGAAVGAFSGDPFIDNILGLYLAPPGMVPA